MLGLVLLAVLVGIGRLERRSQIDEQVDGMKEIRSLVGPLDQRALSGFRILPGLDCLVYRRASNPFAFELCFDPEGRLVEAIDRRRTKRRIYSLRFAPATSTLQVPRSQVDRLLRRMGARS